MIYMLSVVTLILCISQNLSLDSRPIVDNEVSKFLQDVNHHLALLYNKEVHANWLNEVQGPNDLIALLQSEIANQDIIRYIKSISPKVAKFRRLHIESESLKRQLDLIPELGYEVLKPNDLELMYSVTANMSDIQRSVKVCSFENYLQCNLSLIPDVQNIIHSSRNVKEIEYYWLEWRRRTGETYREDFRTFVELYRRTALMNGFEKPSNFWYKDFEESSGSIGNLLEKLMQELRPLFEQFHSYVRGNLRKIYGSFLIPKGKAYPQHLAEIFIGNAYRELKGDLLKNVPYPQTNTPNITEGLKRRGLTNSRRVFWNVADYFRSIGLPQLEHDYWQHSAMPKADSGDYQLTCWHKAWKYYDWNQVNFTFCPEMDEERFLNMFEALSDVNYYKAYKEQPTLFQEEPFPNFSDALGKVFSLAASSPRYLEKLKVVGREALTKEARLNRLYIQGLRIIFLLPVLYTLDRYRVDVLDGKFDLSNNCAYWHLTDVYTGAQPPVRRSYADFDAPAKLLMEVDDQYTSQLLSIVLQFQIYKRFCELTGQYMPGNSEMPLDMCDLSNQRDIGRIIWPIMSLGSSRNYKELLPYLTNSTELSMRGLLDYFQPLHNWLFEENRRQDFEVGWDRSKNCGN